MANYTNKDNCIETGLRADIMRCSMENKNLLNKKGSIYVGTGETITVGGQKIYTTKALELGNTGEILQVKDGTLGYAKVQNSAINGSVNYNNLSNTLSNIYLTSEQFNSTTDYSKLKIQNSNINTTQSLEITTNILAVPNKEISCNIMTPADSWARNIVIKQDEIGQLSLSYSGSGVGKKLYTHNVKVELHWPRAIGSEAVTRITLLYFSFISTKNSNYDNNSSGFEAFLQDFRGGDTNIEGAVLFPNAVIDITPPETGDLWYTYCFRVWTSAGKKCLQVIYYSDSSTKITDPIEYGDDSCKMTGQETDLLISG